MQAEKLDIAMIRMNTLITRRESAVRRLRLRRKNRWMCVSGGGNEERLRLVSRRFNRRFACGAEAGI